MTTRTSPFDLEAVYQGLDAAEAACRPEWAALLDAIAKARAAADAQRDGRSSVRPKTLEKSGTASA